MNKPTEDQPEARKQPEATKWARMKYGPHSANAATAKVIGSLAVDPAVAALKHKDKK